MKSAIDCEPGILQKGGRSSLHGSIFKRACDGLVPALCTSHLVPCYYPGKGINAMKKSFVPVFLLVVALGLPCWSREQDGVLNFLVLGDWGGQPTSPYTTDAEREVADQMGKTAEEVGSVFTMALGDNFYNTGVRDANDPRFQETFEVGYQTTIIDDGLFICSECVHG